MAKQAHNISVRLWGMWEWQGWACTSPVMAQCSAEPLFFGFRILIAVSSCLGAVKMVQFQEKRLFCCRLVQMFDLKGVSKVRSKGELLAV